MTDQTAQIPLQDYAAPSRVRRMPTTEFTIYFAIIFLATIPLATLSWTLQSLRTLRLAPKDPIRRAWSQARIITPMIFSA